MLFTWLITTSLSSNNLISGDIWGHSHWGKKTKTKKNWVGAWAAVLDNPIIYWCLLMANTRLTGWCLKHLTARDSSDFDFCYLMSPPVNFFCLKSSDGGVGEGSLCHCSESNTSILRPMWHNVYSSGHIDRYLQTELLKWCWQTVRTI